MSTKSALLSTALAVAILTTGCTAQATGARLVDAKSIVQLVRNEAGARLPVELVADIAVESDSSQSCMAVAEDPLGTMRRWQSTTVITLADGEGSRLEPVFLDLIESFSANGWSEVTYGGGGTVSLKKPGGDATLEFVAAAESADALAPATITVNVESGCVMTAGENSEEVVVLETVGP